MGEGRSSSIQVATPGIAAINSIYITLLFKNKGTLKSIVITCKPMGNFAENLNLGKGVRPPLRFWYQNQRRLIFDSKFAVLQYEKFRISWFYLIKKRVKITNNGHLNTLFFMEIVQ